MSLFFFGGFYFFGELIFIAFIGLVIFEFLNSTEIIVADDRISVSKKGLETRSYDYKTYYISLSGDKRSLVVEHRQSGVKETLKCPSFDKKTVAVIADTVKEAQKSWFLARSAANQTPKNLYATAKTASGTSAGVTMTAAEASRRNPYSKNYAPPTGKAQGSRASAAGTSARPAYGANSAADSSSKQSFAQPSSSWISENVSAAEKIGSAGDIKINGAKPATSQTETTVGAKSAMPQTNAADSAKSAMPQTKAADNANPVTSRNIASDNAKTPITAAKLLGGDIPSDYNKIPELPKISDENYKRLPDIVPPSFDKNTPDKAPADTFTHDHGEDFHKIVFYYPRRDIIERTERANALFVLYTLAGAILIFLLTYILKYALSGVPMTDTWIILTAGVLCAAAVVMISARLLYSRGILSGLFSKLEITDENLVIDNVRYRFSEMSEMRITSNIADSGRRILSFKVGKDTVTRGLGPSSKPSKRRADEYFTRYSELVSELRKRGFNS